MEKITAIYLLIILYADSTLSSNLFHENTRVEFIPTSGTDGDYFGYSMALSSDKLYVGAPKAIKRTKYSFSKVKNKDMTGSVYICSIQYLNVKQVKCTSLLEKQHIAKKLQGGDWFGATVELLPNTLMVAAPRYSTKIYVTESTLGLQGACHLITRNSFKQLTLQPLVDVLGSKNNHRQFRVDDKRPEYGLKDENIYYYPFGEAGFSATVTKTNNLVLGAPGLMQFTGGIVGYNLHVNNSIQKLLHQPIPNPYLTLDITMDDYFGYSVESGIFERNGSVLYVAGAPRSGLGSGKVLVFAPPTAEKKPLNIKAKLSGPQVGSYFGASLCSVDINADGLDDLLVGAPTFVKREDGVLYDQGAVFVYITQESSTGFILEESGYVMGSGVNEARFGNAIAELGDIDGDGFRDIAIGAPWEDDGVGAVYIYLGTAQGLQAQYIQRIQPPGARAFGWSIAKGVDIDKNKCNDLAVGAFMSGTSYLFRCIPTMTLLAFIKGASVVNLQNNAKSFTAMFCVSAPPIKFNGTVQLNFTRKITVDPDYNRAMVIDDSKYANIKTSPDNEICYEKTIHVNVTADLLKPIDLIFELEVVELMKDDSTVFLMNAARLSNNSILKTSLPVQLMRDCGDDLICKPWVVMKLKALNDSYIPGTNQKFGIKLTVWNEDEPAYGLKVIISLPMNPKRIPRQCYIQKLAMTCDLPQPFLKNNNISWDLELEYNANVTKNKRFIITAKLNDVFSRKNISNEYVKKTILEVSPAANFSVFMKSMPNASITVFRDKLADDATVTFSHFFEIRNHGPSDWPALNATLRIPEKTTFVDPIAAGCKPSAAVYNCLWSIKANTSCPISILLQTKVSREGNILKGKEIYNLTTTLYTLMSRTRYESKFTGYEVTTTLILEPPSKLWYIVGACILFGLIILAIITTILHKCGFFLRKKYGEREKMYELLADTSHISDVDISQSAKDEDKDECEEIEENHNIILSVNMNTASYHKDSADSSQQNTTT